MKCPVCKSNINELDDICPKCKTNFNEYEIENRKFEEGKRTNADCLNFIANINIVLTIISAISIWIMFSTTKVLHKGNYFTDSYTESVINWYGIFGGIGVLIVGFTLFFLLKTIADIYYEVER